MNFDWIKRNRNTLLNSALALIALVVLATRFFLKSDPFPSRQTESLYENWIQDPQSDEETLQALRSATLSFEQSARIAQQLIVQGEGQKAEPFAKIPLDHLHSILPEYAEFAENGLKVASGKFEEAFSRAMQLKEQLQMQGKEETLLYGFNLLRLTSLSRQLQKEDSQVSQELEKFLAGGNEPAHLLGKAIPEGFR